MLDRELPAGLQAAARGRNPDSMLEAAKALLNEVGPGIRHLSLARTAPHLILDVKIAQLRSEPSERFFNLLTTAFGGSQESADSSHSVAFELPRASSTSRKPSSGHQPLNSSVIFRSLVTHSKSTFMNRTSCLLHGRPLLRVFHCALAGWPPTEITSPTPGTERPIGRIRPLTSMAQPRSR